MTMPKMTKLSEILGDFAVYEHPEMLKDEYIPLVDTSRLNKEDMEKYHELLSSIEYALKKTQKYKLYFAEFYPADTTKIPPFEALNHHIHSYFEDMDILKNKMEVFLGVLKNDVKKTAADKADIEGFFAAAVDKTKEVFAAISKHRNPHHHKGARFMDGSLLKAENAHNSQRLINDGFLATILSEEKIAERTRKLEEEKAQSFAAGQAHWIETATKNDTQTEGFVDVMLGSITQYLYPTLGMVPYRELFKRD